MAICNTTGSAPLLKLANLIAFVWSLLYIVTSFLLSQLRWRKFCLSPRADMHEMWPGSRGINQINTLHLGKVFPDSSLTIPFPIIPVSWINFTHRLQKALRTQVWVGRLVTAIASCAVKGFTKNHCSQDMGRHYYPAGGTFSLLSWIL